MSLPLTHAGLSAPGISAALDLKFASTLSLTSSSGITPSFSRASTGSYFDSTGVLRYAPLNLCLQSSFASGWSYSAGLSATPNFATAPDGTNTALKIYATSSGSNKAAIKADNADCNCVSWYAKAAGKNWTGSMDNPPTGPAVWFNLSNGTIGTVQSGYTASIQDVGNGWYRCCVSKNSGNFYKPDNMVIYVLDADNSSSITASGTDGILLWGPQAELKSTPSATPGTYVPTTSSANSAPRFNHTYNGTSWVSRGLLVEEQRTNLCYYSEDFSNAAWAKVRMSVTANNAVAPDGTTTADLVYPNTTGAYSSIGITLAAVTNSTKYTTTVYLKSAGKTWGIVVPANGSYSAWFNLSNGTVGYVHPNSTATIQNVGNGWYRCSVTTTTVATAGYVYVQVADADGLSDVTASGTNGILAWGAQLELGSFATSYTPSLSNSSTVRSADVCQITGGDFSSFWNASEGSFAVEYDKVGNKTGASVTTVVFGTSNSNSTPYEVYYEDYNGTEYYRDFNGSSQFQIATSPSAAPNTTVRIAGCYKANDVAVSRNGNAVLTDTSVTLFGSQTTLTIGDITAGQWPVNGHIARLRYFNKRLTDKQLEDLCRPEDQLKLDLKFSENLSLTPVVGPTPSFSRASIGTYFGSDGILRTMGLNLLLYSEDFTNGTYWSGGSTTRSGNTAVAPDGSLTADTITFNSGSQIYQNPQISSSIGTISVYVKKVDHRYFSAQIETSSTAHRAVFDLDTALVTETTSGTSASISDAGNGWFRCSVTKTVAGTTAIWATFQQSATATFSTGSGSKQFYMWGAQSEIGSSLNTYSKTTSASNSGPRFDHTYDGTSWISKGLLVEEQRTNNCLQSQDLTTTWTTNRGSITANATVAPDGTTTADRFVENTATGVHGPVQFAITTTNGSANTVSGFFKAGSRSVIVIRFQDNATGLNGVGAEFNLSNGTISVAALVVGTFTSPSATITNVGGGWYRCTVTGVSTTTSCSLRVETCTTTGVLSVGNFAGSIYAGDGSSYFDSWGYQMEAGSFPTSYIPTTSASATRSADVCQITGSDFSSFWNASEGSFAFDADGFSTSTNNQFILSASSGSSANSINLVRSNANDVTGVGSSVLNGGGLQEAMNAAAGTWPTGQTCKLAFAYKANDFAQSVNGAAVTTDTSGSIPTVSQMVIGNAGWTTGPLNGHIARLRYYSIRLPNRLLIAKSQ